MPSLDPSLEEASAVDVADLLLVAMARRGSAGLILEPLGDRHTLSLLESGGGRVETAISSSLGEALVVRLAALADVDPWGATERIGRLKVRAGDVDDELLLMLTTSPRGLGGELRRIAVPTATDAPAGPAAGDGERVGAYRLEAELGQGGMGVVYRARHLALDRPVAIKILHRHLAGDPQLAAQFVREGRAASLANHPGIVNVTDFGALPDGRTYLVMELVPSPTLEEVVGSGALEPRRAVTISRRITEALEAAHVRGVVHRDLKPSNVFVGKDDEVKIGDFGAAKILSGEDAGATQAGLAVGTPSYMSPEHARGLPTDERADLYSLGCILFKMLSGRVPYSGSSLMDVLFKHVSASPPPLTSPFGPLPPALEALVHRCLAKRPEERPQSAGELRESLDALLPILPREADPRA